MSISSLADLDSRRASEDMGSFALRPSYKQKFRPNKAQEIMQKILHDRLNSAMYHKDQAPGWATEIAEEIKKALLDLKLLRYKYVVNVTIMSKVGEGARMQCKCYWDAETDSMATETFSNDSLVCVAVAFAVYFY